MAAEREWFEKDYYKILGVAETATPKEITKAYRKLARENHPDANPGDAGAEERFKEISAAYDVVGDAEKRGEYDEVRRLGPMAGGFAGGGFPGAPGGIRFDGDIGDLGDLFGGLFTRGTRARGASSSRRRRGNDLEAELYLSFADAIHGLTTTINITSDATCSTCGGSGAKPGTQPKVCTRCQGRGVLDDNQGPFSLSQPCPLCSGRGVIIDDPCATCGGRGVERRPREVKVRVPAGVADGAHLRLKGRGEPGANGGKAGDLHLVVRVAADPLFALKGRNLTMKVPVTFAEAALGADIRVPTMDGAPVTVRLPAGTPNLRTLRVKGRGVHTGAGDGDLLVTIEVAVPTKLSAEQRRALEAFDEATEDSPRQAIDALVDSQGDRT
ncbi:MAG: molecular chaperone DnaJ [Actinobacteria bacterium]|nr:molecular chaperone DnaJ [Actinomycetota bacterium]